MGSENEELFQDDILYAEDDDGGRHESASSDEGEDSIGSEHRTPFSAAKQKAGLDIAGGSSTSQHSSTLHASLDDELGHSVPAASPPLEIPALLSARRTAVGSMHPAAPRGPHYTRLGTSAPIAIPNLNRWRVDGKSGSGQPAEAASTFIPPHQLSKQDDFMFSFTGASPSATLKRERLRTRNAILRSTGFLEPQAGRGMPIPAVGAAADVVVARTPVQSSLTAALTTIGEA
jgi:hypothetical protein